MNWVDDWNRAQKFRRLASLLVFVLFSRVLFLIVAEYSFYFPADFQASSFLVGRKEFFSGLYRTAFYAHIVTGPMVLVLGFFLMVSGRYGLRGRFRQTHRCLGWIQVVVVAGIVAPSGFIMATRAYTGSIAGFGFAALSLATAGSAVATAWSARQQQFAAHKVWATRCFILLCSPLLLRVMSGLVIATGVESSLTYRFSAWGSWIFPLTVYESVRRILTGRR